MDDKPQPTPSTADASGTNSTPSLPKALHYWPECLPTEVCTVAERLIYRLATNGHWTLAGAARLPHKEERIKE